MKDKKTKGKCIVTANNGSMERKETIDLDTNKVFDNCFTKEDIKERYMEFWINEKIMVTDVNWL